MLLCEKATPNGEFVQPNAASRHHVGWRALGNLETASTRLGIPTSFIDRRCGQLTPSVIGSLVHCHRNSGVAGISPQKRGRPLADERFFARLSDGSRWANENRPSRQATAITNQP